MHNWWQNIFAFTKNTCIGDTEASYHINNHDDGMLDVDTVNEALHGRLGTMKARKLGEKR